jgi:hypothetical protein
VKTPFSGQTCGNELPAGWTETVSPLARFTLATDETWLVQLSFALLLGLINLKAEQKERDNCILTHLGRPMGARHRSPDPVIRHRTN